MGNHTKEGSSKTADSKAQDHAKAAPPKKAPKKDTKAAHPQNICTFKGHTNILTRFEFSPTCKHAATVGEDRRLIVWDLKTLPPSQAMNLNLDLDHAVGCAFSPDDKYVALAMFRSKEIKIYKTKGAKEGAQVSFKTGHTSTITSLQWAYNGKYMVTCSEDKKDTVRVFKPTGEQLGIINPGALEVGFLCYFYEI